MAFNVSEQLVPVATADDFHTKGMAYRQFLVDTLSTKAAKEAVRLLYGGVNDPHPEYPALLVDQITTAVAPSKAHMLVNYIYSSDRRASLAPRVNKDRLNYYGFKFSAALEQIDLPYASREPQPMLVLHGQPPQMKEVWTLHRDRKHSEPREKWFINVSVGGWSTTKDNVCFGQLGKIHQIGGAKMLFVAYNGSQRADSSSALYDVTYEWLFDPGTKAPSEGNEGTTGSSVPDVDRPAFFGWNARMDPENPPDTNLGWPLYSTWRRFPEDLQGWKALPGVPNL